MIARVRAGTTVAELHAELAACGQRTALPDRGGTVGGALAVGQNDIYSLRRGTLRSSLLQVRYVSTEGRVVNGGGPTVKNVTGFDLPRLMVGSLGTLGLVAEVILRTNPIPTAAVWLSADGASPFDLYDALLRPSAVLWNGSTTWILLEGHAADIASERSTLARLAQLTEVEGPPPFPPRRWSLSPSELRELPHRDAGSFLAVVGVGLAFVDRPQPGRALPEPVREIHRRMKANFDPTGRLNPGRDPAAGDS
jgi:glycolate oxidase FAD binding subunit